MSKQSRAAAAASAAEDATTRGQRSTKEAEADVLGPAVDRGSGTVLAARYRDRPVLLRRLPADADPRARDHMVLLAERLVGLDHERLLPVVAVRSRWDVLDVLYEAPVRATSLAALAAQRSLAPGEILHIGRALADGLTRLASTGHTHGRLTAADVLLTPDGAVLMTGYGIAGVLGSGGSIAEDVADLRALLGLLDESGLLARHLDATPTEAPGHQGSRRSTAEAFGALLRSVPVPPVAPRLPGQPAGLPLPRPAARPTVRNRWEALRLPFSERWGWRVLGSVLPAALGVLLLAGWLGASLGPPSPEQAGTIEPSAPAAPAVLPATTPTPIPTSTPPLTLTPPSQRDPKAVQRLPVPRPSRSAPAPGRTPERPDWHAVVAGLDVRRDRLLAAPTESSLRDVDAVGSSAYAADLAIVRSLSSRRAIGVGVRTDLVSVVVRTAGTERADLTVVDVLRPYTIRGADGNVLVIRNGRGERTAAVVLVRTEEGWRMAQVSPA